MRCYREGGDAGASHVAGNSLIGDSVGPWGYKPVERWGGCEGARQHICEYAIEGIGSQRGEVRHKGLSAEAGKRGGRRTGLRSNVDGKGTFLEATGPVSSKRLWQEARLSSSS